MKRGPQNERRNRPKKAAVDRTTTANAATRNTVFRELAKAALAKNTNPKVRAALIPAMTRLSLASANVRRNPNVAEIRRMVNDATQSLIAAVKRGDSKSVGQALKRHKVLGIKPNGVDSQKKTALHWACFRIAPNIVGKLLASGANPSAKDMNGRTCLFGLLTALSILDVDDIYHRFKSCFVRLVQSGLNIESYDKKGDTAFHYMVREGRYTSQYTMLVFLEDFMIRRIPRMINSRNANGDTMLHIAVGLKDVQKRRTYVAFFVENHVDVCVKNNDGKQAVELSNDRVVILMLGAATRCSVPFDWVGFVEDYFKNVTPLPSSITAFW